MFKFDIVKTSIWNDNEEILTTFTARSIKRGLLKCDTLMNDYIRSGRVNDYTTFARGYLKVKSNKYYISYDYWKKLFNLQVVK